MSWLDWVACFGFIAWMAWDGLKRVGETKSLEGYYTGNRRIPWWAAGLSVMGTQASAITVIGISSQGHEEGMDFVQTYFGLPFAMIVLCIFMVPLYRSRVLLTAYEYLENRFGPATRALAALVFLVSRCLSLGIALFAPAVALSVIFGMPPWVAVLLIGGLATIYTVVGGVAAAIWTDVKQMSVIIGGMLLCLAILLKDLLPHLSFGQMLDVAGAAGKLDAVSIEPASTELVPRTHEAVAAKAGAPSFWEQKYNIWSGLLGGFFLHLAYFGCDFSQAQRILTSRTAHESRKALLMSAFAKVPMQTLILFVGVLMWVDHAVGGGPMLLRTEHVEAAATPAYAERVAEVQGRYDAASQRRREAMLSLAALPGGPGSDAALLAAYQDSVREVATLRNEAKSLFAAGDTKAERDRSTEDRNFVFIRWILSHLPPIVLGLVIAAIFAAAMSSADAELNALSAASIVDVYKRWLVPGRDDAHYVAAGRWATFAWGAIVTTMAIWLLGGAGTLIESINRVGSFFYGSLLGVFALALLVPRAGRLAGPIGLCAGMATVGAVHLTWKVEFLWYNVIGCLAVLAAGFCVSRFERRRQQPADVTA